MTTKNHQPFASAVAVLMAGVMLLSLSLVTFAQDSTAPVKQRHRFAQAQSEQAATDGTTAGSPRVRHGFGPEFFASEMRFGDKTVTGVPFSAQVETESTQTLADGTKSTHKSTGAIYRDSQGRMRREMAPGFMGHFGNPNQDPPQMVFISDPVAGAHYMLDARNQTAHKMTPPVRNAPDGAMSAQRIHPPSSQFDVKTESLGSQTIEGVVAEGTRSTITIPAGRFGNQEPVQIVSERWDSAELQTTVMSKHTDPRMGEHIYRLTNINRQEPASSLFEVPSNYTVQEGGFRRGPRGARPPIQNQN
jgi:hypothetical protein